MMSSKGGRGGPQVIPRPSSVSVGGPPPWQRFIGRDPGLGFDDVRRQLAAMTVERATASLPAELRRSAVAVVLSGPPEGSGDSTALEVLLTRRSWGMRTHRGEVAFAGGAEDPGDEFPVGTALREAHEEVGLAPHSAEIVGALDPLTTFTSDRVVVPVVALTPSRPAVVSAPAEVDAVLHVPVAELLHPDCYHQELWSWGPDLEVPSATDHPMHFFELHGDTVWGATAAMLTQLLSVLLGPHR